MRERKVLDSSNSIRIKINDRELINFSSNNYLGLATHPALHQAFSETTRVYGMGAGASQFISGTLRPLIKLEHALAEFLHRDRAILFSSGYMANQAAITALADRATAVFADKQIHASLIDATVLSRAKFRRYNHMDVGRLQAYLSASQVENKLVLTEGVFSMDGSIAPLPDLAEISHDHDALLIVDDAHGIGVLGNRHGAGVQEYFNMGQDQLPIIIGTFGKAFGLSGAFVAGSATLIETILQKGRSIMYTTALMPGIAAAAEAALDIIKTERWRADKLFESVAMFKQAMQRLGAELLPSDAPIQALMTYSNEAALTLSSQLYQSGIYVPAIRTPTVPKNKARIRICITADHSKDDIKTLVAALTKTLG